MDVIDKLVDRFRGSDSERKLVFWYDTNPERELEPVREALSALGVDVWELTEDNQFTTKYQLEVVAPSQSYLVYARFPEPERRKNWLLDILLYSEKFEADDIAMLMSRFHVEHLAVRDFFQKHRRFFNSNDRAKRLESILPPEPTREQLILGMLAVLAGTLSPQPGQIMRQVLVKGLDGENNKVYQDIDKLFNLDDFWRFVADNFGYKAEEPSLKELFKILVYNHFALAVDFEPPQALAGYKSRLANSCRIFIDDWLSSSGQAADVPASYLKELQTEWGIAGILGNQPVEAYQRCDTFPVAEELIIRKLAEELEHETVNQELWNEILNERRSKHWYNRYEPLYRPLEAALRLVKTRLRFEGMRAPADGREWVEMYSSELYQADQLARRFFCGCQDAHAPEVLQGLAMHIEYWYNHVFLAKIALWTDRLLDESLLKRWPVEVVPRQWRFYQEQIEPLLKHPSKHVVVIISDALRYEAGAELAARLKEKPNVEVELKPMQAALPGYTALGMAGLLPGEKLSFRESGSVDLDGQPTVSLANREAVLQKRHPASRAKKLKEFMAMQPKDAAAWLKNQRVVYFYHDIIDSTGDSQKSELYTFHAVADALRELEGSIGRLFGTYGAARIIITSDHGFLFQIAPLEPTEKAERVEGKIFSGNRRFALGASLSVPAGARKLSLAYLGVEEEAVLASGLNRFAAGGGARFVHGGALPQEAILPLIICRKRGGNRRTEQPLVGVRLVNRERLVTDYRYKATFFQEQKVDNEFRPRHLRMAFYQGDERISNEVILVFDSVEDAGRRQVEVIFSLREKNYLSGERCILCLEDVSSGKTSPYREEELELRLYNSIF